MWLQWFKLKLTLPKIKKQFTTLHIIQKKLLNIYLVQDYFNDIFTIFLGL